MELCVTRIQFDEGDSDNFSIILTWNLCLMEKISVIFFLKTLSGEISEE
jgi:hypothetical protein